MSLRISRCLLVAFSLCAFLSAFTSAHADTYAFRNIAGDNYGQFVNADNAGNYTVALGVSYADQFCGPQAYHCYATYSAYSDSLTYTTFTPRLQDDPAAKAGPGCTIDTSSFDYVDKSVCNNGYQYLLGYYQNKRGIYTGSGSLIQFLYNGTLDPKIVVTTNGNLFFADGIHDFLVAGINTSTAIAPAPISFATPEPSSFWLLATGTLGYIGAARRRAKR